MKSIQNIHFAGARAWPHPPPGHQLPSVTEVHNYLFGCTLRVEVAWFSRFAKTWTNIIHDDCSPRPMCIIIPRTPSFQTTCCVLFARHWRVCWSSSSRQRWPWNFSGNETYHFHSYLLLVIESQHPRPWRRYLGKHFFQMYSGLVPLNQSVNYWTLKFWTRAIPSSCKRDIYDFGWFAVNRTIDSADSSRMLSIIGDLIQDTGMSWIL